MALISLTEWAKREGLESSTARKKAAKGLLKTAQKIGRNWVIDEKEKNKDNRRKEMTVKELLELYENEYNNFELYTKADRNWHTDSLDGDFESDSTVDLNGFDYSNSEVERYELMNNEEYNRSIFANSDGSTDLFDWEDDHVQLLILVNEDIKGQH